MSTESDGSNSAPITESVISTEAEQSEDSRNSPRRQAPAFFRWLTYLILIPLMTLATSFFGCISLICGLWDKSGRQQHFIARIWARTLLLISLSPVTLINKE